MVWSHIILFDLILINFNYFCFILYSIVLFHFLLSYLLHFLVFHMKSIPSLFYLSLFAFSQDFGTSFWNLVRDITSNFSVCAWKSNFNFLFIFSSAKIISWNFFLFFPSLNVNILLYNWEIFLPAWNGEMKNWIKKLYISNRLKWTIELRIWIYHVKQKL